MLSRMLITAGLAAAVLTAPAGAARGADPARAAPDTYVTSWDAIGIQAFTAAGLSPAEGHLIFGYVSVAVYDAVVAARPGYEPFAVRAQAPRGTSAEAAVAAAAHRVLAHYLPAQAPTILDPALDDVPGRNPGRPREDRRDRPRRARRGAVARAAAERRVPRPCHLHPAGPTGPGRLAADGAHAAGRHLPPAHATVRPQDGRPAAPGRATGTAQQALGPRIRGGQVGRLGREHHAHRRADAGRAVLGRGPDAADAQRVPHVRHRPRARRRPGGPIHGHGLGHLRRRLHRLLRRQVPLRVLAADHGDPCR